MKITKQQLRRIIREEVNRVTRRSTHGRLTESKMLVRLTRDPDELSAVNGILRDYGLGHVASKAFERYGEYWAPVASRLEARDVLDALFGYEVGDDEMMNYVDDSESLASWNY